MTPFTMTFTAQPSDIDELGHVNNAVWVRWIQDIAVAHWHAVADPAHHDRYIWVVTRHEIDYRGNVVAGDTVTAETWVANRPRARGSTAMSGSAATTGGSRSRQRPPGRSSTARVGGWCGCRRRSRSRFSVMDDVEPPPHPCRSVRAKVTRGSH